MTTWAGIVRSSDGVAARQKAGTYRADEEQVAEVQRYAAQHGATVEFLPPEFDVSGGLPIDQRPSLKAAIEGCERGEYNGIVVANLKRLTRSRSGLQIWERVEAAGGRVHTAAEATDTSTPNGRFMRDIFLADAVREREEHSERHAKRRAATVEAGMWRVRQLPLGYVFAGPAVDGRYKGKARRLKPGPDAAKVRAAFLARAAGDPLVGIARDLRMTPNGVRFLLRNRVYLGELHDGANVNLDAHPAIVTRDEFEAAQVNHPRPPRGLRDDGPALLAGIVRCRGCDRVMTRRRTANVVYGCNVHHSGGPCPAPATVSVHLIDPMVEPHGRAILAQLHATATTLDVDGLRREAEECDAETAAYVEHTSARTPGYAGGLAKREREAAEAWQAWRAARHAAGVTEDAPGWDDLDAAGRNRLLRSAGLTVVVGRAGGRGSRTPLAERVSIGTHLDPPTALGVASTQDRRVSASSAL